MAKAKVIELTQKVKEVLEKIIRQAKSPQWLVKRSKIILMASEKYNNSDISRKLEIDRGIVINWRNRWLEKESKLAKAENLEEKDIKEIIIGILSDNYRSGCPARFSPEQIVKIVGIALERPEDSGIPITNWSETEIAKEAARREIVETISQRSVGRFLKKSRNKTPQK